MPSSPNVAWFGDFPVNELGAMRSAISSAWSSKVAAATVECSEPSGAGAVSGTSSSAAAVSIPLLVPILGFQSLIPISSDEGEELFATTWLNERFKEVAKINTLYQFKASINRPPTPDVDEDPGKESTL